MGVEERDARGGAVRVGMVWGGIGAVIGFLASVLGSLVGVLVAGLVGFSCGRRAAGADAALGSGRPGALSGLIGGALVAPAYVLGASAGAVVGMRNIGSDRIAASLSDVLGTRVSPEQAWQLFLISIVLAASFQAVILIGASTLGGTRAK